MHRSPSFRLAAAVLTVAVSLLAVTAIAAPPQRAEVTFDELAASGVAGNLRIQELPNGNIMFHGTVTGLQPNEEYLFLFYPNAGCGEVGGEASTFTFTSNNDGIARVNAKATPVVEDIGSIAVIPQLGVSLPLACGDVVPVE